MSPQSKAMPAREKFREAFARVLQPPGLVSAPVTANASPRARLLLDAPCRHVGHELALLRAVEMERRLQKKRSGWHPL